MLNKASVVCYFFITRTIKIAVRNWKQTDTWAVVGLLVQTFPIQKILFCPEFWSHFTSLWCLFFNSLIIKATNVYPLVHFCFHCISVVITDQTNLDQHYNSFPYMPLFPQVLNTASKMNTALVTSVFFLKCTFLLLIVKIWC